MTDHPLRPALFRKEAIAEDTAKLNDTLVQLMTGLPEWWNVGAEVAREARRQGRGPFPPPVISPRARTITISGRDGNEIPLRGIAPSRGVSAHSRWWMGAWIGGVAGSVAGADCRPDWSGGGQCRVPTGAGASLS